MTHYYVESEIDPPLGKVLSEMWKDGPPIGGFDRPELKRVQIAKPSLPLDRWARDSLGDSLGRLGGEWLWSKEPEDLADWHFMRAVYRRLDDVL